MILMKVGKNCLVSFILSKKNRLKRSYRDDFFGFGKNCMVYFVFKSEKN